MTSSRIGCLFRSIVGAIGHAMAAAVSLAATAVVYALTCASSLFERQPPHRTIYAAMTASLGRSWHRRHGAFA